MWSYSNDGVITNETNYIVQERVVGRGNSGAAAEARRAQGEGVHVLIGLLRRAAVCARLDSIKYLHNNLPWPGTIVELEAGHCTTHVFTWSIVQSGLVTKHCMFTMEILTVFTIWFQNWSHSGTVINYAGSLAHLNKHIR
jgi:hypothetical protein